MEISFGRNNSFLDKYEYSYDIGKSLTYIFNFKYLSFIRKKFFATPLAPHVELKFIVMKFS